MKYLPILIVLVISSLNSVAAPKLCDATGNFLAANLEGAWNPEKSLSTMLGDHESHGIAKIRFTRDTSQLVHFQQDISLIDACVFMVGTIDFYTGLSGYRDIANRPFILLARNGSPQIFWLNDNMTRRMLRVMMATGSERSQDILFLDSDNEGAMSAFARQAW